MSARYQTLRPDRILATIDQLQARIVARFPNAGLTQVCAELQDTAQFSARDAARLSRPTYLWRFLSLTLIVGGIAAQVAAFRFLHLQTEQLTASDLVQGLDSAVN